MSAIRVLMFLSIVVAHSLTNILVAFEGESELFSKLKAGLNDAEHQFQEMSYYGKWKFPKTKMVYLSGVFRGNFFIESELGQTPQPEIIRVKNGQYCFEVVKYKKEDNFSLSWIGENGDPRITERIAINEASLLRTLIQTYFIDGWFLWDMVNHPKFEMDSVSEDGSLIRCDFRFTPPSAGLAFRERAIYGYFKCDPQQNWAMLEYCKWGDEDQKSGLVVKIIPDSSTSQLPLPKMVSTSGFTSSEPVNLKEFFEFIGKEPQELSEEMFYLSYYGLSEPNFDRRWFGGWVWYLVAGLGCVWVGRFILRRQQASV